MKDYDTSQIKIHPTYLYLTFVNEIFLSQIQPTKAEFSENKIKSGK